MSDARDIIYMQIEAERLAQDKKWGVQSHPDGTGGPVKEEQRDIAIRTCDKAAEAGRCTWALILEEEFREALAETDPQKLRRELIQTIAVATAWIEAIERRVTDEQQ